MQMWEPLTSPPLATPWYTPAIRDSSSQVDLSTGRVKQTWNGQGSPLSVKVSYWWEVRVGPCRPGWVSVAHQARVQVEDAQVVASWRHCPSPSPQICACCVWAVCVNMCAVCVECRGSTSQGEVQVSLFANHKFANQIKEKHNELKGK